jgi:hypothetical protein
VTPHVLVGESTSHKVIDACERLGWGRMWVYRNIRPVAGERWGLDNGVFKHWDRAGPMRPDAFDVDGYRQRVERAERVGVPWLAVVPDLIAAGVDSLDFSLSWVERMPASWPLYLALQDGMTPELVAPHAHLFAGLFLGGSTHFKRLAPMWCSFAHARGMRFHYARCSSPRRFDWCTSFGADSVDSTQMLWSTDRFDAFKARYLNPTMLFDFKGAV